MNFRAVLRTFQGGLGGIPGNAKPTAYRGPSRRLRLAECAGNLLLLHGPVILPFMAAGVAGPSIGWRTFLSRSCRRGYHIFEDDFRGAAFRAPYGEFRQFFFLLLFRFADGLVILHGLDRKSTRLNSSHLGIS